MRKHLFIFAFAVALAAPPVLLHAQEEPEAIKAEHPLDALTPGEIATVADLLKAGGQADKDTLFPAITLIEPPKDDVRAWTSGKPFGRRALAVLRHKGKTYEAHIDVAARKVEDVREVPGAQPMIMDREWVKARDAFQKDERLVAALEKRGLKPGPDIFCTPNSAGYFPGETGAGRRIVKIPCFSSKDKMHPAMARPIEGIMGIVDSDTGEVLSVLDAQRVDLPAAPKGWGPSFPEVMPPINPLDIVAPKGPNIKLSGNLNVDWLNWSFHARADKRAGIILSLVRFKDGKRLRDMAYQLNVSEMFVPYMDPDPAWSYRTFMDAGEFGLGYLSSSLRPGVDCPYSSFFVDLTYPNDVGGTFVRDRALCLFERPTGDPAWRHAVGGGKTVHGEPQVELVVRSIPTLGNYDYVIDYVFSPQGNIAIRVGATGFDAVKSVASENMDSPAAAEDTAYGSMIAPYTVAPYHDHYFNFRLDLDADGTDNSMLRNSFVEQAIDTPTRKSLWVLKTQRYSKEGPISPDHSIAGGELWRLANSSTKNSLKQTPSLWIDSHVHDASILNSADPAQMRAGFTAAPLWVTRYKPEELWAAGLYPNLSQKDEGLPAFVADGEDVIGQDLVAWYTIGFRHLTRPEDFPILPTYWHEIKIRPAFFFDMDAAATFNGGSEQLAPQQDEQAQ
jgi:primary-amine oxidase